MRCPKCKFISYDDLAACAKCSHDLAVLSAELHGSCTETSLAFFLGPAIQTPNFEDEGFSDSQALPSIDPGGINFDDTSSGGFVALGSRGNQEEGLEFDDSVGFVSEDDVAIELGDIMPIDLDQLDATSVMPDDIFNTPSLDFDSTQDFGESDSAADELDADIDLDLTGKFASTNLNLSLDQDFSDVDFDDTNLGVGGKKAGLSSIGGAYDTLSALDEDQLAASGADSGFDLDDDLMAELADSADDLDATATLSNSAGRFDTAGLSATTEFSLPGDALDLDESLLAELSDDSAVATQENVFDISESSVVDLTGDYPPISSGEEPELNALDFSDIDVSDLVAPAQGGGQGGAGGVTSSFTPDTALRGRALAGDTDEELDLDQLDEGDLIPIVGGSLDVKIPDVLSTDGLTGEALPEVELFLDDDEDGPPDLPA